MMFRSLFLLFRGISKRMEKRKAIACRSAISKSMSLFLCCVLATNATWAQNPGANEGVVQGKVTSAASGNAVGDAFVSVSGSEATAVTDSEGNFSLVLPAGTHDLTIEKTGTGSELVPGVTVTAGGTATANASLKPQVEEVIVFGRGFLEGSETSALSIQQESKSVLEVVGSEEFTRLGDFTAADTLRRVTGLNVQEGKFVVIRGQPARYSSTLFHGSRMPSLDPIQTITPLDLFPSGVLANVSVQKAYTADRVGSFGAGQVQLTTSGIPAEDYLELTIGSGVNFESIDSEPLEFNTGNDIWGDIDGDLFDLPPELVDLQSSGTPLATLPADRQTAIARAFPTELAPGFADEGPDARAQLNGGKRFDGEWGSLGATIAYSYRQQMRTEDERRRVTELDDSGGDPTAVRVRDDFEIDRPRLTTNQNAFVAVTAENDNHEMNFNFFWVRDTVERTEVSDGTSNLSDEEFQRRFLLELQQRQMFIKQLNGRHNFFDFAELQWRGMQAEATRDLPDRRTYTLQNTELDGSGLFFLDNDVPNLLRRYNDVQEDTESGGLDVSLAVSDMWFPDAFVSLKVEGGVNSEERIRESSTRSFGFNTNGSRFRTIEEIFAPENLGTEATFTEFGGTTDDYTANFVIDGSYVQTDLEFFDRLRLVLGIRFEQADFEVITFEAGTAAGATTIESGFARRDDLPSFIGSFSITDNMQLRAGAARSLSYPSPIEISNTTFIDPDSDERFRGNPDLSPVVIDSYDVRWEWYPSSSEALTIGFFYKDMTDPIERSFSAVAGGGQVVTFVNADQGEVIGVELNGRVGLDRFRTLLSEPEWMPRFVDDMHLSTNFTYQDSEVELNAVNTAATNLTRRMTGQPETLANAQLGYSGDKHIVTIAAGYQSDRLINAGIQGLPDEFIEPRISLRGKWTYTVIDPLTISLSLQNLVDDAFQRRQGSVLTRDFKTGVTGSLSFKWRFD